MVDAPDIAGLPRPQLETFLDQLGVGAVHARRVFTAVHREFRPLSELPELGPRKAALLQASVAQPTVVIERSEGQIPDETEKLLFVFPDGQRTEGVLIPQSDGRVTFCVSSQVGCAMGCAFCATATMGLHRGLSPGEIVRQIYLANAHIRQRGQRLANIVFMGMGEPLHHYESTRDTIRVITDHFGLMMPARHITVSTVGLVPRIHELAADFGGRIQLALSLNAGTPDTRRRLMPITERWDLQALHEACANYPLPGSRRYLLLEYVLLAGENDTPNEIAGLIDFTRGLRCVVNLIPWNPVKGAPFQTPSASTTDRVWRALNEAGVPVTVRRPRGRTRAAACGQLVVNATS